MPCGSQETHCLGPGYLFKQCICKTSSRKQSSRQSQYKYICPILFIFLWKENLLGSFPLRACAVSAELTTILSPAHLQELSHIKIQLKDLHLLMEANVLRRGSVQLGLETLLGRRANLCLFCLASICCPFLRSVTLATRCLPVHPLDVFCIYSKKLAGANFYLAQIQESAIKNREELYLFLNESK